MTARDEMTALIGTPTRGLCPRSCRDTRDGPHVHNTLDRIASLATNPETAPAVFRWLVEAGVLQAAAFAALPIDEIRGQTRKAVRRTFNFEATYQADHIRSADAASDVWVAALAREFGEPTPLLCDNCGKAMASHGALAECYPEKAP